MMKNKLLFIGILLTLLLSCQPDKKQANDKPQKTEQEKLQLRTTKELPSNKNQLTIVGKNIWVRNKPFTGQVVMKLNGGDLCKILDRTKKVQVRNMLDYWYKIKFHDQTGWVFGSQTNLSTKETIKIEPFDVFIKRFLPKYNKRKVNEFVHKDIGSQVIYNTGGVRTPNSIEKRPECNFEYLPNVKFQHIYNSMPKGGFCEGFDDVKEGLYYWKAYYIANHNKYTNEDVPNNRVEGVPMPDKYQLSQFYRAILINEEYQFAYLYFVNIGKTWYLVTEDYVDCSV